MATTTEIVDRMPSWRRAGAGKWMCKCPAHEDKTASLSIAQTDDGRTLINCFAGCSPEQIMAAIGLKMEDLWEAVTPTNDYEHPVIGRIPRHSVHDIFPILADESNIVAQAFMELFRGRELSTRDAARALLAHYIVADIHTKYRGK